VEECSLRDPSFACVALVRRDWKVEGAFGCLEGVKSSGGVGMRGLKRVWVVVVVVVGLLGVGAL
jgi:hypothetical protein